MVCPPDIHPCPRQSYGRSLYGKDSPVAEQWHPTPLQRKKDRRMLQVLHKRIPPASIRIVGFYRTIDYENKINFKTALAACDIPVVDYTWFTDQKWASEPDAVIAQVEKVLSLLYVPESIICTPDYNKDGSVFCYIISRNYKNMPLLRMYVANLKAKKASQKKASCITKEGKVNINVAV